MDAFKVPVVTLQIPLVLQLTFLLSVVNHVLRFSAPFGSQIALHRAGSNKDQRRAVAMFRLDYLSCFLTVVATILLGRKMWTGLLVSGLNSLIVCVIGLHTSQYGFIPANVFCICINAFNLRTWLKVQKDRSESTTDASSELLTGCKRMSRSNKTARRRLIICHDLSKLVTMESGMSLLRKLLKF
jgi:hypothetical protein